MIAAVFGLGIVLASNAPAAPANPAALPPAWVRAIKAQPDQAPDCASLQTMAESVTRGCSNNDAKAIAIYNFMQLTHYHRQYPSEPGGLPVLKEIHCYGWSLCGGLHAEQSALWRELGWDWRFVGWDGHTTVEARYDDRWHYLDVFLKFYAWMPDGKGGRTIAGEDDLQRDSQALIQEAYFLDEGRRCVYRKDNPFVMNGPKANWRAPAFLGCGDELAGVIGGLKTHRGRDRSEGWGGIQHASGGYTAEVGLAPGFSLENTWDPLPEAWYWAGQNTAPAHTCGGHKDTRNDPGIGLVLEPYVNSKPARSYANGFLRFSADFSRHDFLGSFVSVDNVRHAGGALAPAEAGRPAAVVLNLTSPYILTRARGETGGAAAAEVSVDDGKTYQAVELADFTKAVKGRTAAHLRLTFREPLRTLEVEAVVQNNPGALPYLSPGRNLVTVSAGDARALGSNQLAVTYGYRLGARSKSFEQLCEQDKEIARQHDARWSDTLVCAQKTFGAGDLPATYAIDCPTPRGQYPVYPRMMFLRREVIPAGAAPQPLPAGAVRPQVGPNDELAGLPNPFLVGAEPPPLLKPRPVRTLQIPLKWVQYVNDRGEVSPRGTLRWPKNRGEEGQVVAGAILLSGALGALPVKGLAAARLTALVTQGHPKAPGRLGVVFLRKPIQPGQACDLKELADVAATALVPRQPEDAPEFKPAARVVLDVTRAVKAVAAGETRFHGLALRMVPDRATDEGWTVRCEFSAGDPIHLEVDVFAD